MAKWVRKGECNQCGFCCLFSFDPVKMFFPSGDPKRDYFLKIRGFESAVDGEQEGLAAWGRIYNKCPLQVETKCSIFGKPERPQLCCDFPESPKQIIGTPCSYWFEDAEGTEPPVGGEASPYPTVCGG